MRVWDYGGQPDSVYYIYRGACLLHLLVGAFEAGAVSHASSLPQRPFQSIAMGALQLRERGPVRMGPLSVEAQLVAHDLMLQSARSWLPWELAVSLLAWLQTAKGTPSLVAQAPPSGMAYC